MEEFVYSFKKWKPYDNLYRKKGENLVKGENNLNHKDLFRYTFECFEKNINLMMKKVVYT